MLPTDSVARFRKKDDMPGDGYAIDTDANAKLADAHGGARLTEFKKTALTPVEIEPTLASTEVFGSRLLPAAYLSPYAGSLAVSLVDRSLLPAPAVQGSITPDGCLAL